MIFLYLVPEFLQNPLKILFSLLFAIGFLEMCDFRYNYNSLSLHIWAFSLYIVVNQEMCEKYSGLLSLPFLSLYFLCRRSQDGDEVFLIMILLLACLLTMCKKRKLALQKNIVQKLTEENQELAELKNILIQEIESEILIIAEKTLEEPKITCKSFQKIRGKIKSLIKRKKQSEKITLKTKKEESKYFIKEINDLAKRKLGIYQHFEDLKAFLDKLHFHPKYDNADNKKTKHPQESTQFFDISEPDNQIFSDILVRVLNKTEKNHKTFCFVNSDSEIKLFPMSKSLLLLKKSKEDKVEEIKKCDINEKLLASVSHDMRSPLNGIIFYIKAVKEADNEALKQQKLGYALINAQLLLFLVNDILDYSRNKNNGALALNLNQFPLNQILEDVYLIMRLEALNKGIALNIINECPKNLSLYSDEVRLKQILINLLANAIKFTFKGFVQLRVSSVIPQENLIKFEVIDTGLGIKQEIIPLLMKPFATFDIPDRKINRNGIGLGLHICKTLASALGPNDELFIYSEEGRGSKFGFTVYIMNEGENTKTFKNERAKESLHVLFERSLEPFYEENALESDVRDFNIKSRNISCHSFYNNKQNNYQSYTSYNSMKKSPRKRFQGYLTNTKMSDPSNESSRFKLSNATNNKNVLIVDDQVFNLMILYEMITNYSDINIIVEKATNGLMALEMFTSHNDPKTTEEPFNLIFMDCEMPLMRGDEAAKLIKKKILHEGYTDLKIVACTGDVEKDKNRKKEKCMDEWLVKPVDKESVYRCLKKYL